MRVLQFCFVLTGCLAVFSCSLLTQKKKSVRSPMGYDLSTPRTIRLDETLDEISGIGYDLAGNRLVAVNDEEGRIYTISLPDGNVKRGGRFAKGGDFNRKHANRIMRLRIIAQAIAVALIVAFAYLHSKG